MSDEAKVKALESLMDSMRGSLETQHDVEAFLQALTSVQESRAFGAFGCSMCLPGRQIF